MRPRGPRGTMQNVASLVGLWTTTSAESFQELRAPRSTIERPAGTTLHRAGFYASALFAAVNPIAPSILPRRCDAEIAT